MLPYLFPQDCLRHVSILEDFAELAWKRPQDICGFPQHPCVPDRPLTGLWWALPGNERGKQHILFIWGSVEGKEEGKNTPRSCLFAMRVFPNWHPSGSYYRIPPFLWAFLTTALGLNCYLQKDAGHWVWLDYWNINTFQTSIKLTTGWPVCSLIFILQMWSFGMEAPESCYTSLKFIINNGELLIIEL